MNLAVTTDQVAEAESLDFWQDVVCRTFFRADCHALSDRPFRGAISTTAMPQIAFSRVRSQEQRVVRTESHVRQTPGEVFLVNLQLSGTGMFSQDGREAVLQPGDFTCSDSTRPCTMNYVGDFEQLVFYMPRDIAMSTIGRTDRLTALPILGGSSIGSIVAPFLRQVASQIRNVEASTADRLSEIAMALAMTALGELAAGAPRQPSWGRIALLHRAKMFVDANAGDHSLSPSVVAAALGISLRYLQDLFRDDETTPSEWMWRRRLEMSRRNLSDPLLMASSISEIAFACGFADLAHFSRRFKAAYGTSPREFRLDRRRERLEARK